jgi:arsenate reductase
MKILILCTGNSCRSQMAEGFLKSFDSQLSVFSAGTHPAAKSNPYAVAVMKEAGIDISQNMPKRVDLFLEESFDYVITVCDDAKESCPLFSGDVRHRVHLGFEDPAGAKGTEKEVLEIYRKIRDQISGEFLKFYNSTMCCPLK